MHVSWGQIQWSFSIWSGGWCPFNRKPPYELIISKDWTTTFRPYAIIVYEIWFNVHQVVSISLKNGFKMRYHYVYKMTKSIFVGSKTVEGKIEPWQMQSDITYIYHVPDMINVWDTASTLIFKFLWMFPPTDILYWIVDWIIQNGPSLYQLYILNLG